MSHTWQARSSKARQRTRRRKRQITRSRQLSTNERAGFSAEEVRTLVEQMRKEGIAIPRLRDEQQQKRTGELRY